MLVKLVTAIQLTRLTMAFGAVADVWFVILLTRADEQYEELQLGVITMGLPAALLAGAFVAIGLFAYGAALNDVLDVRHDSTFSPDRPIPAGHIKLGQAVVVAIGALIVAVLAGASMGTWALWTSLLTAAGILFYNAAGKFIPAVGLVTLGLLHAAHMLIPNAMLAFTLPVWLVMTHAMAIGVAVHILEDKRPRLRKRSILATVIAWIIWSIAILGTGVLREGFWPEHIPWWALAWPLGATIGFLVVGWWKASAAPRIAAAEKLKRYGAMWQALYGASWLAALGLTREAMWIGGFAVAGFAVMTFLKELSGLHNRPIMYR